MNIANENADTPCPPAPTKLTYPEIDAVYRELYALKSQIGSTLTRRERVEVMIGACILRRFDTQGQIVKVLGSMGFSMDHVIKVLHERTGPVPSFHLWQQDEGERYRLLSLS